MTTIADLTPTGALLTGTFASFGTTLGWQPLFMIKNSIMTGKGLPQMNPKNLYRGYPINACCDMTNQSVAFFANNFFNNILLAGREQTSMEKLFGGFFSGMMAAPLLCICDRIMIVQQLNNDPITKKALALQETIKKIHQQEGFKGFFRGLAPTGMRESINAACFFGLQKVLKPQIERLIESKETASSISFLVSGLVAGTLTTPADLIKTNMQSTIGCKKNMLAVTKELINSSQHNVIRALFKGCLARTGMMGCLLLTLGTISNNLPNYLPNSLKK